MTSRRTFLGGAALLTSMGASRADASRPDAARWDAAIQTILAGADAPPALAGMVVGREGPLWIGAAGVRRAGDGARVTTGDLWHLGSNTKAMTAALYGRLADAGQADWSATLAQLLPEVSMDAAWRDTPLTAVMGHVAGLSDATAMGRPWLMTARSDPRGLTEQRRALVEAMLAVPPAGTPGVFAYGNANYVLLGAVIERIAGRAWEDVLRTDLFAPLGIASGGFGAPPGEQPWGHDRGAAVDPKGPVSDNPPALGPAGTAHMTLGDYARFLGLFLGSGQGVLSRASLERLTRPAAAGRPAYGGGWLIAEGQPWAGGPALTHDGSNTLWHLSTWVAPAAGRAFVAASNDGRAGAQACRRLIPALIQAG